MPRAMPRAMPPPRARATMARRHDLPDDGRNPSSAPARCAGEWAGGEGGTTIRTPQEQMTAVHGPGNGDSPTRRRRAPDMGHADGTTVATSSTNERFHALDHPGLVALTPFGFAQNRLRGEAAERSSMALSAAPRRSLS